MDDAQQQLESLREAWLSFKDVVDQTSEEQHQAFRDLLTEMDTAEAAIKRERLLRLYEHQSSS